jgi:hypothetical protein
MGQLDQSVGETAEIEQLRRENARLRAQLGRQRKGPGWRRTTAWILLVVGLIAIIPADILLWANRTVTNTDNYVATVAPIIKEPAVQQAVTKGASSAIFGTVDVQAYVASVLPDRAQPLAGPITTQVKNYTTTAISKIVASDKFAALWVDANRRAQERFMYIAQHSNGSPDVDVSRLYSFISQNLQGTPLSFLAGKQLPAKIGDIHLVTIPALAAIPHFVSLLSDLRWLLLAVAVGLLLLALAAAVDRRRMAVRIGLGWIVVSVVAVILVRILRTVLLGQVHDPTYNAASVVVWQALLTPLFKQTVILVAVGAVIAIIAWALGPGRVATAWRTSAEGALGRGRASLLPAADQAGWARWLRRHHAQELWALLLLTIAALLLSTPLTPLSLAVILIIAALAWILLEFLVVPAPAPKATK